MQWSHWNCTWALLVVSALLLAVASSEECDLEEFSKCTEPLDMQHLTSELSVGSAKKEDLMKHCQKLRKGVRCIQSFTRRCMDLQQRKQLNKLYHGTTQFIRDLCNKGEFQDDFLRHIPCLEMVRSEFEVCANRYKETMVLLKENGTLNENIKTICCSINELVDCSGNAARRICANEAAKFTHELVDKYANSLTKIYCEDFTHNPGICQDGEENDSNPSMQQQQQQNSNTSSNSNENSSMGLDSKLVRTLVIWR
ncbi:uncharacterized protein Dana_GF11308 [Drosophila ananassae]|uniref:Protein TsetseEP domain-containing protein n=1 Tax=Drosophila ananassae TaxID=7217 RepID=B3MF22_DROAN|nr:uncharacterized protein LOC6494172 [Drosophila ananassae]EDV37650.1 uncharacterized protein Dana_GF11308 [Drosophila ananassae]